MFLSQLKIKKGENQVKMIPFNTKGWIFSADDIAQLSRSKEFIGNEVDGFD